MSPAVQFTSLTALMEAFRRLPQAPPRGPTLLEIAGVQHQELPASNILVFYLDPAQPHGLGGTVLAALLDVVGYSDAASIQQSTVETEVVTKEGKRLDLVIDTPDVLICIENKIYHTPINPFKIYRRYLEQHSRGRRWIGILLALQEQAPSADFAGFQPISYPRFFTAVRERIADAAATAREPYLTFLHDFIQTIDDLSRETTMDAATLAFFRDHQADVDQMLVLTMQLREEMRRKLQSLQALIDTHRCVFPITAHFYNEATMLSDMLVYTIEVSPQVTIVMVVHLKPSGWMINLYNQKGDRVSDRAVLEALLQSHGITIRPRDYPGI